MNFKEVESSQKLSGSYYTPRWLADYIIKWVIEEKSQTILEPSCGDGVFFESLNCNLDNLFVTGIDTNEKATQISRNKLEDSNVKHEILTEDFITWSIKNITSDNLKTFDAAIGNPPFIRYQYLDKNIQENAQVLFDLMNMKFTKHTNAWIPFVIASIKFLRPNGLLGMIVPAEILHVLYAKGLREYILEQCSQVLIIDPENQWFDGVLQGVVLLMAKKKSNPTQKTKGLSIIRTKDNSFVNENPVNLFNKAVYINGEFLKNKWTYALLTPEEREVYNLICANKNIYSFSDIATADVGIVTGANKYFLVTDETVEKFGLNNVASPMFGRSEHCPGIIYNQEQHDENRQKGYPTNFLHFTSETDEITYSDYIKVGIDEKINSRYKCKIRSPWYKVPSVYSSPISLLKRSNGMPRLILNEINAYTTDTAYRVSVKQNIEPEKLVFCFLNTLTALSAELEGRHYGGGVLELVPSEIDRLMVPYIPDLNIDIKLLNNYIKIHTQDEVLAMQDDILFRKIGIDDEKIRILQAAFSRIKNRRQHTKETDV